MSGIEHIKNEIKRLYETNPNINVNIKMSHPKIFLRGIPARIVGVYRNVFQIEENDGERHSRHTFQYVEVFIGQVEIAEIQYIPETDNKKTVI